ncbi:MAG TPA: transposase, partial [Thermaerobacter sp.]
LEAQVEVLTAEIARQVAEVPEVRLLLTVTGVGLLTAATIWAKLGDPGRFRGPKQVVRYAGLDPSVDPSGERDRRGPISRHGDRLLRRALIEAAWSVARHDEGELGQFFRRKAAQIGTRKAIVVLAQALDRGLADPADRGAVPGAKAARRAAEAVDAPPLDAAGCGQGGGWAAGTAGHPGPARYGIGVGSPGGSKEEGGNGVPPGGDLTSIRSEKPPAFRQGLAGRKAKNSPALTIPK